jgi:hypothetical protein
MEFLKSRFWVLFDFRKALGVFNATSGCECFGRGKANVIGLSGKRYAKEEEVKYLKVSKLKPMAGFRAKRALLRYSR